MKHFIIILVVLLGIFCVAVFGLLIWNLIEITYSENGDNPRITFYPEESYFIDYTIKEDTIQIRYSFCFENHIDSDLIVSVSATFDSKKHFDYHNCYFLTFEDGSRYFRVNALEKSNYILILEKEYSGEEIEASFPSPNRVLFSFASEDLLK